MNAGELFLLLPLLILCVGAVIILVFSAFREKSPGLACTLALVTMIAACLPLSAWRRPVPLLFDAFCLDPTARLLALLFIGIGCVSCLIATEYIKKLALPAGEFFALIVFAVFGLITMAVTADLIVLFIGLEILSLCLYVLCGYNRAGIKSTESSLKYFITGAFSSAVLLYGIALLYGIFGTTSMRLMAEKSAAGEIAPFSGLLPFALACIISGLAFKIAAFPFHAWVPDVYEGAPTPVTAFMSCGVKAAAFVVLLRVILFNFNQLREILVPVLWWLAVVTMSAGNLAALAQKNVKRMLAYSAVAHAGYILIGIAALDTHSGSAARAVVYYLFAYAAMNLGIFTVVSRLEDNKGGRLDFDAYRGVGFKRPWMGICVSVFLFSLVGIPPFAGFFAKYFVFSAAVEKGFIGLAVIGALNSLVSVFFYLRLLVCMYMQDSGAPMNTLPDIPPEPSLELAMGICFLGTILLGLAPFGFTSIVFY